MTLSSINHVTICVANIEQAVNWYQSSFVCELIKYEPTFAVLEFANMNLVLSLPSLERPHIAFNRENAESFGELKEMRDGSLGTYIADPTGNIVELVKSKIVKES
jgi:catechol 2,3-dioxygenase-like lactoylglutathione lyase family enzyme